MACLFYFMFICGQKTVSIIKIKEQGCWIKSNIYQFLAQKTNVKSNGFKKY